MENYKKALFLNILIFLSCFLLFLGVKLCFAQIESIPKFSTDYLFNFVTYGDSRSGYENHQAIVSQIEKLNPDFILHTGDFVYSGDSIDEWNKFLEITSNLRTRPKKAGLARNFYPTIGNHELPLDNYLSIFNFDPYGDYYYSFDYKKFLFVSLNTEENYKNGSDQHNWLLSDLKKAKNKEIIVFFHQPVYSSGSHGKNLDLQEAFSPVFEEYNVKMVFSGHDHIYERTFPILGNEINNKEGVTYVVTGGGGAELYPVVLDGNWWTAKAQSIYHFVYSQVTNSKIYSWVLDREGNIIDNFEVANYKTKKSLISAPVSDGSANLRKFSVAGKLKNPGFFAFPENFKKGVRIATGDINLNGKDEIIVGAGKGGSPHVRIFMTDGRLIDQFFAFEKSYKGGIDVATGDVDGDRKVEIAVSKSSGNHAEVKIFRYNKNKTVLFERNVFPKYKVGATVSLGDVDGDGKAELIAGSAFGKKSEAKVFDIEAGNYEGELSSIKYLPFGKKFINGIDVAAGDVDGDGKAEIAVSKLYGNYSDIKVFEYDNLKTQIGKFRAFPKKYKNGANIEMFDANFDGKADIIVSQGEGEISRPQIRIFDYLGNVLGKSFLAYDRNFNGGVMAVGVNE